MKWKLGLLVLLLIASCEDEPLLSETLGKNAGMVGTWIENGVENDLNLMKRASELDPSRYGFTLEEDGKFIERKNAGWCGTPPITYDNYEGSWEAISDSLIGITVGYWGGTMTYQIRIDSLGTEELKIKYLYDIDRAEARKF